MAESQNTKTLHTTRNNNIERQMSTFMNESQSLMTQLVDFQRRNLEKRRENHSPIRRMTSLTSVAEGETHISGPRGNMRSRKAPSQIPTNWTEASYHTH